jgi:hypothetical protein
MRRGLVYPGVQPTRRSLLRRDKTPPIYLLESKLGTARLAVISDPCNLSLSPFEFGST